MTTEPGTRPADGAASYANDGRIPIRPSYAAETVTDSPAVAAWRQARLKTGGPFRPRYMGYSGLGSPEMTAERLEALQEVGAESFLLAAALPSQLGFDPYDDLDYAQVGRTVVSWATL